MIKTNQVAEIGRLLGEPARAAMMITLMDGQALTASELAYVAQVTPQTASSHLAQLVRAKLLAVVKQGRHRYHRLASPEIAQLVEQMMQVAGAQISERRSVVPGPRDEAMRRARTCYDHFAGRLGVAIADSLIAQKLIVFEGEAGMISQQGRGFLQAHGLSEVASATQATRPQCRPCLDWSERRPHIAGSLGAVICQHFLKKNFVRRIKGSRALEITPPGREALLMMFGLREV
ncbi:ArsR/SmtB family transcription factor [Paremcibacter congregatus]|uniref:Transcriptional regulator n=1 Tax=Paremcibacter congregatus TaxID=2043170 RepID=A0A2G4YXH4_9PROT|nr:helix-turn-helix transcriptional regulator [Paremcibacter congregatus]PHZ86136.1 transcriptional regulator [Paremcibacter congregatus]QDE27101.1 helix-turn-helix transcriptional regulator [Paremcibacter congregatus]